MFSVPLMNFIPATSHDYKLVLLGAPLAMLLFFLSLEYGWSGSWTRALQIAAAAALAAVLALSHARLPVELGNKYPFILALQMVLLWAFLTTRSGRPLETRLSSAPCAERNLGAKTGEPS
jgi:hypothetical protein